MKFAGHAEKQPQLRRRRVLPHPEDLSEGQVRGIPERRQAAGEEGVVDPSRAAGKVIDH